MMFNRRIIDQEEEVWQFEAAQWIIANFGGLDQIRQTELVLPTKDFFPTNDEHGHELALLLWSHVKSNAGMSDWPCNLVAQEEMAPRQLSEFMIQQFDKEAPLGTFGLRADDESQIPTITYDIASLTNPIQIISTLAHELAHYLMATSKEVPPGGWEVHEEATDFLAVFMGFGIFLANSAFQFQQHGDAFSQGWQSKRSGYLSENALINILSLFLLLKDETIDQALEHLKSHLGSILKKAKKLQLKDPRLEALKNLGMSPND